MIFPKSIVKRYNHFYTIMYKDKEMKIITYKFTTALLAAIMLPMAAMAADLSKHEKESITKVCQKVLSQKGYEGYTYKYTDILKAQSDDYSMSGQLHKNGKRFGYNCLLEKKSKLFKVTNIVVNAIGK